MIRVLIADDSALIRMVLRDLLARDPGIQIVAEVGDGRAAVAQTTVLRPDLVIMDVMMPVMDGLEAVAEIMSTVPTPILMLSANTDPTDSRSAFSAIRLGALDVMAKPSGVTTEAFSQVADMLVARVRSLSRIRVMHHFRPQRRAVAPAPLPVPPPPQPEPAPRPVPTPPPPAPAPVRKPEPVVEKPDPRAADIALKAKAEAERRKRAEVEREKRERELKEAQKREAEARKLDEQKRLAEARERQAREAEALKAQAAREVQTREAEALKAQAARERQAREASALTAQAAREAQVRAEQQAAAAAGERARADYISRIQAKIKGNINEPGDIPGNPEATFSVVQLPTGEIIDVRLVKSSGLRAYDEAVERAIRKSSPLPLPTPRDLWTRDLQLKVRPRD